jgi:hypothetical protein
MVKPAQSRGRLANDVRMLMNPKEPDQTGHKIPQTLIAEE